MERPRFAGINPEAEYSIEQLSRLERELAGVDRSPYGPKIIRRMIRDGLVYARRVANRDVIKGRDWIAGKRALPPSPLAPPDVGAR